MNLPQNNLEEQLQSLNIQYKDLLFANFKYAPYIKRNENTNNSNKIFSFQSSLKAKQNNSAISSVSASGVIDLEIFRSVDSPYASRHQSDSNPNFTGIQTFPYIQMTNLYSSNYNEHEVKPPKENEIDESLLADFDVDAIFAAEASKKISNSNNSSIQIMSSSTSFQNQNQNQNQRESTHDESWDDVPSAVAQRANCFVSNAPNYSNENYQANNYSSNYSTHDDPMIIDDSDAIICRCGIVARKSCRRSDGRSFYTCYRDKDDTSNCHFFQWCEEEIEIIENNNVGKTKDIVVELKRKFGHTEFRPGQKECIEAALRGDDVFCLMPTGGGKSIVYQVLYLGY